jgi:predicted permease
VIKGIEERLRSLPGIVGVGTTRALPLESGGPDVEFTIDGRAPVAAGELGPRAFSTAVTPDYFGAMRMRVVRGRALTPADDRAGAPRVIVINETLARRFWSGENPVGRSITLPGGEKAEIVGIVADIRQRFLTNAVEPQMFVAWAHAPETQASIVVRGAGDPTALVDAIRREVWAVDPLLPVEEWTLDSLLEQTLGAPRFQTLLLLAFASAALLLAAMGVYALVSYAVAQRTREIGVRMALGARRPDVLRMVLRQGIALTTAGVSLGILGALSLTQLLEKVLYGVSTTDPATHAAAALFLATIAILATYLPARRATEVDPVVALRSE